MHTDTAEANHQTQIEQQRLKDEALERAENEKKEAQKKYARGLQRQHKAQMLQRAKEIQDSLMADLK